MTEFIIKHLIGLVKLCVFIIMCMLVAWSSLGSLLVLAYLADFIGAWALVPAILNAYIFYNIYSRLFKWLWERI